MRSRLTLLGYAGALCVLGLLILPPLFAGPQYDARSLAAGDRVPRGVQAWGVPDAFQLGRPDEIGFGAYDGRTRTARYRLEFLSPKTLAGSPERRDNFHADKDWPAEYRATLRDYAAVSKIYDRGHLHPAGDSATQEQMDATFALSNMAPQHKALNRGLWKQLEEYLRQMALLSDLAGVWVGTVPLYAPEDLPEQGEPTPTLVSFALAGPNHVPIPTHFAKVALFLGKRGDNPVALRAWVFSNRAPGKHDSLDGSRCSVDLIEHYSGLDFFAELPDELEKKLEATK